MAFRFLTIAMFMPFLTRCGYGLMWKEVIVLSYGALRGAVGITFALIVSKDDDLPKTWKDIIIFHMCGMSVLTLLLNGTTISLLLRGLGLST